MSQISIDNFINGIKSIIDESPSFANGKDGSDAECDGIGLVRGGLLRGGATRIKFMKDINQFVNLVALDIRPIADDVHYGDVLLKAIKIDGITDFTDISVVISNSPVNIVCMTKDGISQTSNLSEWDYTCKLPYISYGDCKNTVEFTIVQTENDSSAKMFEKASFASNVIDNIPNGAKIVVNESNNPFANVLYNGKSGYILSKFIKIVEEERYVSIDKMDRETLEKAYVILGKLLGYVK